MSQARAISDGVLKMSPAARGCDTVMVGDDNFELQKTAVISHLK